MRTRMRRGMIRRPRLSEEGIGIPFILLHSCVLELGPLYFRHVVSCRGLPGLPGLLPPGLRSSDWAAEPTLSIPGVTSPPGPREFVLSCTAVF